MKILICPVILLAACLSLAALFTACGDSNDGNVASVQDDSPTPGNPTTNNPNPSSDSCPAPTPYTIPLEGIEFDLPQQDTAIFKAIYAAGIMDNPKSTTAIAFVDANGDGLPDIYLVSGGFRLFINDGCF